jgi:hypothetical protein
MQRGLALILIAAALGGCASQANRNPLIATADFVGARDDVLKQNTPLWKTSQLARFQGENAVTFPPSTARVCDLSRTRCRSGVVATELRYRLERADSDTVQVAGNLISKMGRAQTFDSSTGAMSMSETMSLDSDIELLGERKEVIPFHQTLKIDQPLKLAGLGGTQVTLFFSRDPDLAVQHR